MDGFSVAGITSRTLSKATDLADKYGIENVYNDIDLLMNDVYYLQYGYRGGTNDTIESTVDAAAAAAAVDAIYWC